MYTFNEFRARIPIQEIARSLGYWVNPAGGEKFLSLFLGNPKHPEDEIVKAFKELYALNRFLNQAVV